MTKYKLVPVEPTDAMLDAWFETRRNEEDDSVYGRYKAPYQAMLDAAPISNHVLVPLHPTHEMCEAAHFGPNCAEEKMRPSDRAYWEDIYKAMIGAAVQTKDEQ